MKTSILPTTTPLFVLLGLFAGLSVQAQGSVESFASIDSPSILAKEGVYPAKNTPSGTYHFDLSAGQQTARFDDLESYVAEHLSYPEIAEENCMEGTVKVLLVISPEGKVMKAEVLQSLNSICDKAALDMLRKMPNWKPAMNYGIPVKGKAKVEVLFRLH